MVVRAVAASSLTRAQLERWSAIQQDVPALSSPFFSAEFTRLVASVRGDVHVGLLERDDELVGFFPFQRLRFGVGRPVGLNMSDYNGLIAAPGTAVDVSELLRGCQLKTWEFDHVPASQAAFARFSHRESASVVMDLSAGYEAYEQARKATGSSTISQLGQKARKLEREHGEVRYVQHTSDRAIFDLLLEWKERQYQQTGAVNILHRPWARELLRLVHEAQDEHFAGLLSVLYAGPQIVAIHLGIRSATVLHSWFPAYDPAYSRYSPGQILFLKLAEAMPALGIRAIDLGPGEQQHKLTMRSYGAPLLVGVAAVPSLAAQAVHTRRATKELIRRTSLAPRVRSLARGLGGVLARR
jgi:CelD/BcsL family acetyltransferase involved in cellulose biosynthesis